MCDLTYQRDRLRGLTDNEVELVLDVLEVYKRDCQHALTGLRGEKKRRNTKVVDRHIDYYKHVVGGIRWIQGNLRQVKRSSTDATQHVP